MIPLTGHAVLFLTVGLCSGLLVVILLAALHRPGVHAEPKGPRPQLSLSQYFELDSLMDQADDSEVHDVGGYHFQVIAFLQRLGYGVNSWEDARKKARQLLDEGWKDDGTQT